MPDFLSNIAAELPFTLLLLALLGLRARVTPVATVWVKAPADKVFGLIDLVDGKVTDWGRTLIRSDLVDRDNQLYKMTYETTLSTGSRQTSHAFFRVAAREENTRLELHREGLEGKSHNNELLKIIYHVGGETSGSRLTLTYRWGPRPLIAQLLARADLLGGAYRLKGLAETGRPNERPYLMISAAVAIMTGLVTLATFAIMMGFVVAALLVVALLVHEYGHLLAYRLMGQPWGRLVFLPFLGALAVPRLPYQSQGQAVFAALMGPAFSAILAVACAIPLFFDLTAHPAILMLGLVTSVLNLFNMLPVEPLDGGVALRSVLARLMGRKANWGLMAVGAGIALIGLWLNLILLIIFGGIAILANLKNRAIDRGLNPLSTLQLSISAFGYMAILAAHATLLRDYLGVVKLLQS
jgi:Zn-dependent protease